MLQQTQVATVIPYFERFIARFPNVRASAAADEQDVLALWSGLGYYRRARMLHAAAREIVAKHGGEFPSEREAVLALPGIGRYTAGAILSIAFNKSEPIVDGNVARVFSRITRETRTIKGGPAQTRAWAWAKALVQSGSAKPRDLNQALMELGATICTRHDPRCDVCPVSRHCKAKVRGDAASFPRATKRAASKVMRYVAWLARDKQGRVLLVRRNATHDSLLPVGLWELPHAASDEDLEVTLRHTIMNWRIELCVRAGLPPMIQGDRRWFETTELENLPMASITKKVLTAVQKER